MLNKCNRCYFCNDPNHLARDCKLYKKMIPYMKTQIGDWCESFFANNYKCYRCKNFGYKVLNNRSPSLDIVCQNCGNKCEVKSKCYSGKELADDIFLHHGSYEDYVERQKSGLDLVVIIYKINRRTKKLIIREILYFPNEEVKKKELIQVNKKKNSNLSQIIIPNRCNSNILKLPIKSRYRIYDLDGIFNYINFI